jgi:hypothetical protein
MGGGEDRLLGDRNGSGRGGRVRRLHERRERLERRADRSGGRESGSGCVQQMGWKRTRSWRARGLRGRRGRRGGRGGWRLGDDVVVVRIERNVFIRFQLILLRAIGVGFAVFRLLALLFVLPGLFAWRRVLTRTPLTYLEPVDDKKDLCARALHARTEHQRDGCARVRAWVRRERERVRERGERAREVAIERVERVDERGAPPCGLCGCVGRRREARELLRRPGRAKAVQRRSDVVNSRARTHRGI